MEALSKGLWLSVFRMFICTFLSSLFLGLNQSKYKYYITILFLNSKTGVYWGPRNSPAYPDCSLEGAYPQRPRASSFAEA